MSVIDTEEEKRAFAGVLPKHLSLSNSVLSSFLPQSCLVDEELAMKMAALRLDDSQSSYYLRLDQKVQTPSTLLRLPLEIRRHIYEYMLDFSRHHHVQLLCVCRQVYVEARESFFKRPLFCHSQKDLMEFIRRNPPLLLENLTTLKIRLEDLDPRDMQPFLAQIVMGLPTSLGQHPYFVESQRIIATLQQLPNIKNLTIARPATAGRSPPPNTLTDPVLSWMTKFYTDLHSLRLDTENCSLHHLSAFGDLRLLRTTGFSETDSEQTLESLRRLHNLADLEIVGPPPGLRWRQKYAYQHSIRQSFVPEVISQINPLSNFMISELPDAWSKGRVFLTTKMVRALRERHIQSLQSLRLSSAETPDEPFIASLSSFLMNATNLRHLSLTWPALDTRIIYYLPESLQTLEFAISFDTDSIAVLELLLSIQQRLPCLREVHFVLIGAVTMLHDGIYKNSRSRGFVGKIHNPDVITRTPWSISWGVWQPIPTD